MAVRADTATAQDGLTPQLIYRSPFVESRGVRVARLQAVKSDICGNLGDCGLSVAAVAARQGVTSRYIHKLFESEGATFSEYVLDRRLCAAHRLLRNRRLVDRSIASVAFELRVRGPFLLQSHFPPTLQFHANRGTVRRDRLRPGRGASVSGPGLRGTSGKVSI